VLVGGGLVVGAAGTGAVWAATGTTASGATTPVPSSVIPPDDDLMREHGVLKRVLLCYREMTSRILAGDQVSAANLQGAALIIHDFIEGFHEGLEEGYVFPRLLSAKQLTSTVDTLLVQHARGRVITQYLLAHATSHGMTSAATRGDLAAAMQAFDRMYEPHEAREDTVVFPAYRQLLSAGELVDIGQHFEDLEREQFGTDEFTAMTDQVASIEQSLGIYDLTQFTPQVTQYLPPE
jgi:hemerythrin-like domain-containing protein